MIEGHELTPNLWVLQNSDTARNTPVILAGDRAVVVDAGNEALDAAALERFLADMEKSEGMLHISTSSMVETPLDLPGWEAIMLAEGVYYAFYNKKERTLVAGDLLHADSIPRLAHGSQPYLDALDRIEALDVRLLVPLYGPEARGKREIKARIEQDCSYTLSLLRHVTTSRAARAPLDRVLQVATEVYEDYPHLQAHLQNIRFIWEE